MEEGQRGESLEMRLHLYAKATSITRMLVKHLCAGLSQVGKHPIDRPST